MRSGQAGVRAPRVGGPGHPEWTSLFRPVRLIAPNRPGVLQTKWVGRLEVLS